MKPTFANKLTASYLFVVAVTLLITGAYLTHRLKANFHASLEQSLSAQAQLMKDLVLPLTPRPSADEMNTLAHRLGSEMRCRVTIVRADGVVLGDSERTNGEVRRMDNHGNRPEIQAALRAGGGESTRHSATLNENMLYVAVPIPASPVPWGVVRVALPLNEVDRRISAFQADLLKAGVAALGVAFGVALIAGRKVRYPLGVLANTAQAIGEGQFAGELSLSSSDEFGRLARAFSDMSRKIQEKVGELRQERTQLSAILSALVEGVVAVDHEGRVLF
jgi:two-component system phosphate regulon sensor histidine kinase PhoR